MERRLISDDFWTRLSPILPGKEGDPGRSGLDNRQFVEAVLYIARTGAPWRDLPSSFGQWNSIYQRFARWQKNGVWERIFAEFSRGGDFNDVLVDSTCVRAHQHAAGAEKKTVTKRLAALAADLQQKSTP